MVRGDRTEQRYRPNKETEIKELVSLEKQLMKQKKVVERHLESSL